MGKIKGSGIGAVLAARMFVEGISFSAACLTLSLKLCFFPKAQSSKLMCFIGLFKIQFIRLFMLKNFEA